MHRCISVFIIETAKNIALLPTPIAVIVEASKKGWQRNSLARKGEQVVIALLGWTFTIASFAVIGYALYKRLYVIFGLKILFAAFTFEAKDHVNKPITSSN